MIIEIIVLLFFVGSIAGFVFFIKHYFKASSARKENKKILLAIEKAEDENASDDKFYRTIWDVLGDVRWDKVITFFIILGMSLGAFVLINPALKQVSTGNIGVNNTMNQTAGQTTLFSFMSNAPWWIYIILIGITIYIFLKIAGASSYHGGPFLL